MLRGPSDRITMANRAAPHDRRIHADLDMVVLCRCAQDVRISGEIPLRQGRHHATTARTRDAQANLIAEGERVADPGILNETPLAGGRLYDDIRSKSPNLKTPSRLAPRVPTKI